VYSRRRLIDVLDVDVLHRVWNALSASSSSDQSLPNETGPKCPDGPEQFGLNDVSYSLRGVTSSPSLNGMIECPAFPPVWVFTGEVAGEFIPTNAFGLSNAIDGQEAPLTMLNPSPKKLQMLRI
jgi:hypothetical protein